MQNKNLSSSACISWQEAIVLLQENKVILAPSDTVWGLCGAATEKVFLRLNELKVRNEKPYLLLAASLDEVEKYAFLPQGLQYKGMLAKVWPGPLTVILKAKPCAPAYFLSKEGTIAFRIPAHKELLAVLKHVPLLFSTSANSSGEPTPSGWQDVFEGIKVHVAGCVQPAEDECQINKPSTIIDLSHDSLKVVREGALAVASIEALLKAQLKDLDGGEKECD